MPIKNLSRKKVLADSFRICDDIFSKALGLMFSRKQARALIFVFNDERKISLHMFFVFYPIDVIFLDKRKIVVDFKENFRPFSFYSSRRKSMYTVELPNGTIRKSKTEIGDKIWF